MALTFYSLLEACLLLVNAVAVLHEERFLAKGSIRSIVVKKGIKDLSNRIQR